MKEAEKRIRQVKQLWLEKKLAKAEKIPQDPIEFCEKKLEFKPTSYQRELAQFFCKNQFVAARWCRQSGKSQMIAVMARYNPFAEHAGMKKICESKPDKSILEAVAELEKLGFTPYLLAVPEYNKRMLEKRVPQVKEILSGFSYPYNRRIAGQHGHFTMEDYRKWLKKAETKDLAQALTRLAQLNQSKIYLFWKHSLA